MQVPSLLRHARSMVKRARVLLLMLLLTGSHGWCGPVAVNTVVVVFPDIGEPYRSVFATIIEGIKEQAQRRVVSIAVDGNGHADALSSEMRQSGGRSVIALGRNGLKAATAIDKVHKVVVGGVLSVPETETQGFRVYSLSPDPALLFARLKSVMPQARRVSVVYDPRQNAWLILLAREAARALGLELLAHEAEDLKSATRLYQEFALTADPQHDVLWLPQDSTTVGDATVVPWVMQEAWRRNFAVISSSVAHVRRGALLSLYPDFIGLGRSLAASALAEESVPGTLRMQPLTNVLTAVNTRAAQHLGLRLDAGRIKIDFAFPED